MAAALPLNRPATAPAPKPRQWPRFALVFAAIVAIVSLLPYLLAYLWTPPGHHFAGFFVIAADHLCRRLLPVDLRRLALVLVILGSGAGFVAQALGNPSVFGSQLEALDLHLPEISGW